MNISALVAQLKTERSRLDSAIAALEGLTGRNSRPRRRRGMSAASRRKIAAAQKARWAKWRARQR